MSEEDICHSVSRCLFHASIARYGSCGLSERFHDSFLVRVHFFRAAPHIAEQRFRYLHGFELIPVLINRRTHFIVFRALHQVRRLDNQRSDAIFYSPLKSLLHIVDFFPVTCLYVVYDDLGRKCPAH